MELAKIKKTIKDARPHLTESTLKSYGYNVLRVYKLVETTEFEKNAKLLGKKLKEAKVKPSISRALVNACVVYEKAKGKKKTEELDALKQKYDTEFLDQAKLQVRT